MPLSDTAIRKAKAKEKQYKLSDARGLYLLVGKTGRKYFRFDYRFMEKRKTMALGVYPDVSLADARQRREAARKLLAQGIDPSQHKKESVAKKRELFSNTFEVIAREWFGKKKVVWSSEHALRVMRRLEKDIFPFIGGEPIKMVTAPMLLEALMKIEQRGAVYSAHVAKQTCGQVFRYAIVTGKSERDPSADLRGALTPVRTKNMATIIDPKKIGGLLRAIDGYDGQVVTQCALKLAPLVFVRPGELRRAEWSEIDIAASIWKIPAHKMKMKVPHIVPLSKQAIDVIQVIEPITSNGRYVFPSLRPPSQPMSENTINAALRRMGYAKDEMTGHGFRGMASTLLHEQGWRSDIIERQLSHAGRSKVENAYNHAKYLPDRREMMQAWADFLDGLRRGNVIPFPKAGCG